MSLRELCDINLEFYLFLILLHLWCNRRAVTITALPHHRGNEMPTAVLRSSPSSPHFFCKVFAGGSCLHSAGPDRFLANKTP